MVPMNLSNTEKLHCDVSKVLKGYYKVSGHSFHEFKGLKEGVRTWCP